MDSINLKYKNTFFYWLLFALTIETLVCLFLGFFSNETQISNNNYTIVTAYIQNYNYLLAAATLLVILVYLAIDTKKLFNNLFTQVRYKIITVCIFTVFALLGIIKLISVIDTFNDTSYGSNSRVTVPVFVTMFITTLTFSIINICFRFKLRLLNANNIKKELRNYIPIILLVCFMCWTFIGCINSTIIKKAFNGSYSLKDGYWAFLMYGVILITSILLGIGNDSDKKRLNLISSLTICITLLTAFSFLINKRSELTFGFDSFFQWINSKTNASYYLFFNKALFRNVNHYCYLLSIVVVSSVGLMVAKKELWKKYLYYFCYLILASILIKSDTFGAYLGVAFSIIFMLLHAFIIKKNILPLAIVLTSFILLSIVTRNADGKMYLEYNFKTTYNDLIKVKNYITSTNTKNVNNPPVIISNNNDSTALKLTKAKYEGIWNTGAGRMQIWFAAIELIKQKPIFGFGLESLHNEFYGQFGLSEGRTHNLILQLSATTGIPGMLLYIIAISIVLIRNLKNYKNWNDIEYITMFVCISYMISSMFGNSSYYVSPYFMLFVGFIIIKPNKLKNNIDNPQQNVS
jgi:hypothetical protein